MACSTRWRVAGRTFGRSLSTRETVWCDTPARRATSKIFATRALSSSVLTGARRLDRRSSRVARRAHYRCRSVVTGRAPVARLQRSPSRREHLLQDDEHEQQRADEDARPPRRQRALEGDDRLDDAEHQHAEHRAEHEAVAAGEQGAADDHGGDGIELGADRRERVARERVEGVQDAGEARRRSPLIT